MHLRPATDLPLSPTSPTPRSRIDTAARELETQFAQLLIKSMRATSIGDPLAGDNSTYRDMYDQQLARELTKGRGLGLAPIIARQLERSLPSSPQAASDGMSSPMALPAPASPMALPLAPSNGVSLPALDIPTVAPPQASAEACDPNAPLDCSSPEAFVRSVWPHAQRAANELGVSPKALVAQAALETGWGRRLAGGEGASSNNLFGIKAGGRWSGARVNADTHEYVDGVRRNERASFRAYGSAGESFADYARLMGNNRYAGARAAGHDTRRYAQALQSAGYATDPSYAAKITAIAEGPTLNRALAALDRGTPRG